MLKRDTHDGNKESVEDGIKLVLSGVSLIACNYSAQNIEVVSTIATSGTDKAGCKKCPVSPW